MNCYEVAELEESYLLGQLKGEEMNHLERHLKACLSCAKKLSGYQEVLGIMFSSLKPAVPAAHLRQAVLNQVAQVAQEPISLDSRRKPFRRVMGGIGRVLSPVAAVMVIGLTMSTLFLGWQLQEINARQAQLQEVVDLAASPVSLVWPLTEPGVPFNPAAPRARMYARPDSDLYLLTATQLKPAPQGQVYRAWYTIDKTVDYLGDLEPDQGGNAVLKVSSPDHRAANITACFITKEKAGSPIDQPSGPQFLAWNKA
jgi:hypothetical protein